MFIAIHCDGHAPAAGRVPVPWGSVPAWEPVLLLFPICSLSPQNVLIQLHKHGPQGRRGPQSLPDPLPPSAGGHISQASCATPSLLLGRRLSAPMRGSQPPPPFPSRLIGSTASRSHSILDAII